MLIISIHAPREGATQTETRTVKITLFQSTLPVRERPRRGISGQLRHKFQSTLPVRERR